MYGLLRMMYPWCFLYSFINIKSNKIVFQILLQDKYNIGVLTVSIECMWLVYSIGALTVNIEFMWLRNGVMANSSDSFHPFRAEPHTFYIYRQYTNKVQGRIMTLS
jgi:hypothetical protein